MLKYIVILICMQLTKGQYDFESESGYQPQASYKYQSISSDEDLSMPNHMNHNHFNHDTKRSNKNYDFNDSDNNDEDYSNGVEKSISSVFDDVHEVIMDIRMKLNDEFKRLTNLDQQNQEKAKKTIQESHQEFLSTLKTIQETRKEIENRVGYVQQFLYKKRAEGAGTGVNEMNCVGESLSKLAKITPELMKDEEGCISNELEMSRSVAKVTLDMIRDSLQKIKQHQERLNKCNTVKRRKQCLIQMYNGLVNFKKIIKASVTTKMTETVAFLNGLSTRMRTCSMAQIGKVVNRAGDVIVKFNSCVKGHNDEYSRKKKSEMMLFVV